MMKTFLLLLLPLFAVLYAKDYRQQFEKAMAKYSRRDGLLMSESSRSRKARYVAFSQFAAKMEEVNNNPKLHFKVENNFFSILKESERARYMGFKLNETARQNPRPQVAIGKLGAAAAARDFRQSIFPNGVKDQGSCGSCWTFSASASLEAEIYFINGKNMEIAEQEFLDCAGTDDGCNGGWMDKCYDYARSEDRAGRLSDIPYQEQDNGCSGYSQKPNALELTGVKVTGSVEVTGDVNLLNVASSHVVAVAIFASTIFSGYKSGVYTESGCTSTVNHAVNVVGYGEVGGDLYWLVRNSWGSSWGQQGYVKMDRATQNLCHISEYGQYPEVACRGSSCTTVTPDDASEGGGSSTSCWGKEQKGYTLKKKLDTTCHNSLEASKAACVEQGSACIGVYVQDSCYYLAAKVAERSMYFYESTGCSGSNDTTTPTEPPSTEPRWTEYPDKYLESVVSGNYWYYDLATAKTECTARDECSGVTWEPYYNSFWLRWDHVLQESTTKQYTWFKECPDAILKRCYNVTSRPCIHNHFNCADYS